MQQSAMDPTTGIVDMDLITTGISGAQRHQQDALIAELEAIISGAFFLSSLLPVQGRATAIVGMPLCGAARPSICPSVRLLL
jgi:hypothetical protein